MEILLIGAPGLIDISAKNQIRRLTGCDLVSRYRGGDSKSDGCNIRKEATNSLLEEHEVQDAESRATDDSEMSERDAGGF